MDKQIEEMARDMDYGCVKRDLYPDDAKEIAKALYLLGYRKIPENAVVLTREEYERQQKNNEDFDKFARSIIDIRMQNGNKIATFKDLQDYIELQVKQGNKETARKLLQKIRSYTLDKEVGMKYLLGKLEKEYGVENNSDGGVESNAKNK